MWAEVRHSDWPGYLFRLTFRGGQLHSFETRREGDDAAPLSAHLLQRVPLGALERAVREHINAFMAEWRNIRPEEVQRLFPDREQWFDTFSEGERPVDPKRDLFLATVAKRYVETIGDPDQTLILAEEFDRQESSVAALIREARHKRKLLTPTRKGRAGGELTPKARVILGEVPEEKMRNAWERATAEQQQGAIEIERLLEESEAALIVQYRAGKIDATTFTTRMVSMSETWGAVRAAEITDDEYAERLRVLANQVEG
jgi:hypothetical protein